MYRLNRHPSPATVISIIALFVSLGGTGYAAIKLPANSVNSKQIKNKSIKSADLAKNAVTGDKVKDGSLSGADLAAGVLPAISSQAVSTFAYETDVTNPAVGTGYTELINLTEGTNGGQLVMPFDGRITVNASIHLADSTPSASDSAGCLLELGSNGAFTAIAAPNAVSFNHVLQDGPLSLSGGADKPAGTYDVRVRCKKFGTDAIYYDNGGITAVATKR